MFSINLNAICFDFARQSHIERFTLAIYAEVVYKQSLYQIPRQSIFLCQGGGAPATFALPMSPEGRPVEESARCTYRQVATAINKRAGMI
jgi:hypothetical protein